MLYLSPENLRPYLTPNPLPNKFATLVDAWAPVLEALLAARFGDRITADNQAVFVSAAADAIQRRLDRTNRSVMAQSVNGASVSYSASLWAWFYRSELAELDGLVSVAGARSVRMQAPPTVVAGNRFTIPDGSDV